jgi:periplasmic divalent cation tolerance protein
MAASHLIALCTVPDAGTAERLARLLIEKHLAACVNIMPGLTSVYDWQGQIETADELLLLIKTRSDRYPGLEAAIRDSHPYELPEIISVPIGQGLEAYFNWIDQTLTPS